MGIPRRRPWGDCSPPDPASTPPGKTAASSRPTVAGVGCPYELGPTQITATLGRVSARNAEVVEYREPWCATLSTSMGGPRAQMLPTAASLGPVQSPVQRKLLPPASRRSTTLS